MTPRHRGGVRPCLPPVHAKPPRRSSAHVSCAFSVRGISPERAVTPFGSVLTRPQRGVYVRPGRADATVSTFSAQSDAGGTFNGRFAPM